jgi:multidrug efflux pump subunit AcrB
VPLLLVPLAQQSEHVAGDTMKPTLSSLAEVLVPLALSLVLVWVVINPVQLWVFNALAVVASCAPAVFLFTFLLVGWRNRTLFVRTFYIAPPCDPC